MLEKMKKFFEAKREQHKHDYDLTFDNVAIPEVHTHKSDEHDDEKLEHTPISYDNVAIPEVHIRSNNNKKS